MSTDELPAGMAGIVARTGELLADGGHRAKDDKVRAAAARMDDQVVRRLRAGTGGVDAAVNDVAQVVCDRLATRLLQGRELGEGIYDVAVLHAVLDHHPAHWFEVSCLDDVDLASRAQNGR